MNRIILESTTIGVVISLLAYQAGILLKKRFKWTILNPMLVALVLIISFLKIFNVDYESYNASAKYLTYLLTPTTVCLAIPLYRQLELLKNNLAAILAGVLSGAITSLIAILGLSVLFGLSHQEYVTMLPKSVTAAIGMGISTELGGYVSVSMASITITGVVGSVFGGFICRTFRIKESISKGLALGTASHAIGTARALEMGEVEGAMSSLAIVVAGLFTVIGAPLFAGLW